MTDQAPSAAGTGQGAPVAPTTPAASHSWLEGADEVTVGYVQNKGWSEPKQVLESYRNLEKLMGADRAGNTVVLPKPDAPQADVDAFYNRLGRPADPTGYKIELPKDGGDPEFAKTASAWFHEQGLTAKQGEALAAKWNEHIGALTTAQKEQLTQAYQADDQALKTEWGAAFQQNLTAAQAAARGLGLDAAAIDKLQGALGHKGVMDLLYKIGSKVGEPDFAVGTTEKFGAAMTPAQAKATIQARMQDKGFTARYLSKDSAAVAEMKQLHDYAYPEAQ